MSTMCLLLSIQYKKQPHRFHPVGLTIKSQSDAETKTFLLFFIFFFSIVWRVFRFQQNSFQFKSHWNEAPHIHYIVLYREWWLNWWIDHIKFGVNQNGKWFSNFRNFNKCELTLPLDDDDDWYLTQNGNSQSEPFCRLFIESKLSINSDKKLRIGNIEGEKKKTHERFGFNWNLEFGF